MASRGAAASTKEFEKAYVARSGSAEWEAAKPFSPPGADTLEVSAGLLHDFAVAILALQPGPADLILDLGSGGCWCSELLHRLHRRVVAVDISFDMVRIGRSRMAPAPLCVVNGDVEQLPFRPGAFHKAVCLNALHHVPDIPKALDEISRVLSADGVALFSEPGRGHSSSEVSQSATRQYGVLEQEILFGAFADQCREAGFEDVRLKALSYALPMFELTAAQWERWSTSASRRRPRRALTKMWRATLELLGLGKERTLFADTFERSLLRALSGAMRDHPVILASKRPLESPQGPPWSARISIDDMDDDVRIGQPIRASVTVTNLGRYSWRTSSPTGIGFVTVGVQLLDAAGTVIERDFHRLRLAADVPPQCSQQLSSQLPAPVAPGRYAVKVDVVAEGIAWFESVGSQPAVRHIRVR